MKKLRFKIESLNLSYKKEIGILLAINLCLIAIAIALYLLNVSLLYIASLIILIGGVNIFYLNRYNSLILLDEKKLENEFIELFSYLRIYLYNDETVYQALNNIKPYASIKMSEKIEELINGIDNDKSIEPFIKFSKNFKNKIIEEVMISLYELVNNGSDRLYLNQFIKIFEDFKNNKDKEDKERRYKGFDNINMLSIIGSGFILIILSLAIINLLGEVTSGF